MSASGKDGGGGGGRADGRSASSGGSDEFAEADAQPMVAVREDALEEEAAAAAEDGDAAGEEWTEADERGRSSSMIVRDDDRSRASSRTCAGSFSRARCVGLFEWGCKQEGGRGEQTGHPRQSSPERRSTGENVLGACAVLMPTLPALGGEDEPDFG